MLLTRESDYAARLVAALAKGGPQTAEALCARQEIPLSFGYKIIRKLEKAGILQVRRGAAGGCRLCRRPEGLTLLDIYRAVDKKLCLQQCLQPKGACQKNTAQSPCRLQEELRRVQRALFRELGRRSLREILDGPPPPRRKAGSAKQAEKTPI